MIFLMFASLRAARIGRLFFFSLLAVLSYIFYPNFRRNRVFIGYDINW